MNRIILSVVHASGAEVALVLGDITEEKVDAIVNAANTRLAHGGGVAGAIVRRGGEEIQRESDELAPVKVGQAVITGGGRLHAPWVIHTVGPRWGEGEEELKLASAVRSALLLAGQRGLATVSLPAISTGIYGYPMDAAVTVILSEIRKVLDEKLAPSLRQVRVVLFDQPAVHAFMMQWDAVWNPGLR